MSGTGKRRWSRKKEREQERGNVIAVTVIFPRILTPPMNGQRKRKLGFVAWVNT